MFRVYIKKLFVFSRAFQGWTHSSHWVSYLYLHSCRL